MSMHYIEKKVFHQRLLHKRSKPHYDWLARWLDDLRKAGELADNQQPATITKNASKRTLTKRLFLSITSSQKTVFHPAQQHTIHVCMPSKTFSTFFSFWSIVRLRYGNQVYYV